MARWMIEKSGTGVEKAGTGIEKSGTGIERSGSGIEKSGTGVSRIWVAAICSLGLIASVNASESPKPEGMIQIVATDDSIAVSWIFDGSVFSGITKSQGRINDVYLAEVSLNSPPSQSDQFAPNPQLQVVGTGSGKQVVGSGSGTQVVGAGSGTQVVGAGSGTAVVGAGSGQHVVGSGSGSSRLVVGTGSGAESIAITLPEGTGLRMEVAMGCNSATVTLLDSNSAEVAVFENQPVFGAAAAAYCVDEGPVPGFGAPRFGEQPNLRSEWEMR